MCKVNYFIVAVLVFVFHLMKLLLLLFELLQMEEDEGDGRKDEESADEGASWYCCSLLSL